MRDFNAVYFVIKLVERSISSAIFLIGIVLLSCIGCQRKVNPINEHSKNGIIVVLGSSTAYGTGATAGFSWVERLQNQLIEDRKDVKINNLALGGFTTYNILPSNSSINFPADPNRNVIKAISYKPIFVIINLPTNDIAKGFSDTDILNNYSMIIRLLKEERIPYFITSTQPRNFVDMDTRKRLNDFNEKMKINYADNFIDYYINLTDTSNFKIKFLYDAGDGIHVNNKGHQIIFEAFYNNISVKKLAGY